MNKVLYHFWAICWQRLTECKGLFRNAMRENLTPSAIFDTKKHHNDMITTVSTEHARLNENKFSSVRTGQLTRLSIKRFFLLSVPIENKSLSNGSTTMCRSVIFAAYFYEENVLEHVTYITQSRCVSCILTFWWRWCFHFAGLISMAWVCVSDTPVGSSEFDIELWLNGRCDRMFSYVCPALFRLASNFKQGGSSFDWNTTRGTLP